MRWVVSLLVSIVVLALPAAASAKFAAAVTVEPSGTGSRLVVMLSSDKELAKSKQPSKLSLTAKGKSYKLSKRKGTPPAGALGTWQSSVLKGKAQTTAQGLVGKKVSVMVTAKSGPTKTVKATAALPAAGGTTPGGNTTPVIPVPTGPVSLFGTPATPLDGKAASDALLPYLVNSRFTDCVAGWPNCLTAHHFSQYENGDFYYCRLTSAQGADIKSYASNLTLTGANQATDGSWAISYAVLSYGEIRNYRWDVTPQGAATGQYWNSATVAPGQQPTDIYTGYQWVRGAKDCSY